jgi:hypothetical protein
MQPLVQCLETVFLRKFPLLGSVLTKLLYSSVFKLFGAISNKFGVVLLFLLVGFGQLSAHSQKEKTAHSLIKTHLKNLEQILSNALQNNESLYVKPIVFGPEKQNNGTEVLLCEKEEKEEDELMSSKKYFEIGNYSIALFGAHTHDCFFNNGKKILVFSKFCSSYTSSNRYLAFQVFRL